MEEVEEGQRRHRRPCSQEGCSVAAAPKKTAPKKKSITGLTAALPFKPQSIHCPVYVLSQHRRKGGQIAGGCHGDGTFWVSHRSSPKSPLTIRVWAFLSVASHIIVTWYCRFQTPGAEIVAATLRFLGYWLEASRIAPRPPPWAWARLSMSSPSLSARALL